MTMPASDPQQLWEADPDALIPHEEVRGALTNLLIKVNTPFWDRQKTNYGSKYFLKRKAGLAAYSAYEADFYLRNLTLNDQRKKSDYPTEWSAYQYGECIFIEYINQHGTKALADDSFAWLFDAKRKLEDASFFRRVGAALNEERAERCPNPKIKMYAWGYDRYTTPWEYCPDSLVAQLMFHAGRINGELKADKNVVNRKNVEKWRSKYLGLKTTKPFAAKWNRSTRGADMIVESYSVHGIPMEARLRQKVERAETKTTLSSEPKN